MRPVRSFGAVPAIRRFGGPRGGLVAMAARADVRDSESHREIRAWNTEAVVPARVDDHIGRFRRVTVDTAAARRAGGVEVMGRRVEAFGAVTAGAEIVALGSER